MELCTGYLDPVIEAVGIYKMCIRLENMTDVIERKCGKFVAQLIGD